MSNTTASRQFTNEASTYADQAVDRADDAIESTRSATTGAFERLSSKVNDLRSQAAPLIDHLSGQALDAKRRSLDAVRGTSDQLRTKALKASDETVSYIKDEPFKAVLIAAATGAVLMGLLSLLNRSSSTRL